MASDPHPVCLVCAAPATCLCDMPIARCGQPWVAGMTGPRPPPRLELCDAPLCDGCSEHRGERPWCTHLQLDYCPEHTCLPGQRSALPICDVHGVRSDCEQGRHDLTALLSTEQVSELRATIHSALVASQGAQRV